jgi:hypothetical protein
MPRNTYSGLSLERHKEIGAELAYIQDRLVELCGEVRGSYPKASAVSKAAFRASGGGSVLIQLRSQLEEVMFKQHDPSYSYGEPARSFMDAGNVPGCNIYVYWPRTEDRKVYADEKARRSLK